MDKSQEVTYAKLHSPIFIPIAGNYKDTLTADVTGPDRNMKMYLQTTGLYVETKGVRVFVPLAAISHMVLASEKTVEKNRKA